MVADKGGARDANPAPSSPREFQRPQVLGQLFRAAGIFEQIKGNLKRRGQQSFRAFTGTDAPPTVTSSVLQSNWNASPGSNLSGTCASRGASDACRSR